MTVCMPKRQTKLFLLHYPRSNKVTNKQSNKKKKTCNLTSVVKPKKGRLLWHSWKSIFLGWQSACHKRQTWLFLWHYRWILHFFMMPQSWRFEALSTLLTPQIPLGLSNLSQLCWAVNLLSFGRLGLILMKIRAVFLWPNQYVHYFYNPSQLWQFSCSYVKECLEIPSESIKKLSTNMSISLSNICFYFSTI